MKNRILTLLYISLLFSFNHILAEEIAGKVAFSFGQVSAQDSNGVKRELSKGDDIFAGDTLITEEGRLQVSMTDGAFISVQPRSQYVIEDYHFKQESDGKESSIYRLLKGGIRAVTGLIGKRNREAYKVHTPAATIGIRGTGHNTRICAGDCFDALGNLLADGLHHSTWEGQTFVQNATGIQEVPTGKGVFIQGSGSQPKVLNSPPKIVRAVTSQNKKNAKDRVKKQFVNSEETVGGVKKNILQAVGFNNQSQTEKNTTFVSAFASDDNQNLDVEVFAARAFCTPPRSAARLSGGNQESVLFTGDVEEFTDIGDVQIFRWTNGNAVFFRNGVLESTRSLNSNQGLHITVIDQTNVMMPTSLSADYVFNSGDPKTVATQSDGLATPGGGLDTGSKLTVNFATASLDAFLNVNGPSDIYTLIQNGIPITNARFQSDVNVTSSGCSVSCSGRIAGGFGSNTKNLTDLGGTGNFIGPTHIGLAYGINDDTNNTQIQGAAILTGQ